MWINQGEATTILQHIGKLIEIGVHPGNVAVITPFVSQKWLSRTMLSEEFEVRIEVETADAYHGQGKNIVLVSLVRNNPLAYGFEDMAQFVKFSMTRTKHHFFVAREEEIIIVQSNEAEQPESPKMNLTVK